MVESNSTDRRIACITVQIRHITSEKAVYARHGARVLFVLVWIAALGSAVAAHNTGAAFQGRASLIGVGAALGGSAGNLMDILRRHSVTDFIDPGWWPAFNLADAAILGGLALALWPIP